MNSRPVLVLCFLMAALVALSVLLWGNSNQPETPPMLADGVDPTPQAAIGVDIAGVDLHEQPANLKDTERTQVATKPRSDANPSSKLCVVVKDAKTLQPAADVDVHFIQKRINWQNLDEQARLVIDTGEWFDWCQRLGKTLTTNAAGCIFVERGTYLGAACEDRSQKVVRYGKATLEGDQLKEDGPFSLLLHEQQPRREVAVINSNGKLLPYFPITISPIRQGNVVDDQLSRSGRTGADGKWRIRDQQGFIADHWSNAANQSIDGIEVRLNIPQPHITGKEAAVVITFRPPPQSSTVQDEPLVLQAPDTGSVILRLRDPLGNPSGSFGDLWLSDIASSSRLTGIVPTEDGDGTKFLYVPLGLILRGSANTSSSSPSPEIEFAGPIARDQIIEAEMQTLVNGVMIIGRLIDASDQPIASTSFRLSLFCQTDVAKIRAGSSADGHFMVEVDIGEFDGVPLDISQIQLWDGPWHNAKPRGLGADLKIKELRKGVIDVGDIRILELPILATGRTIIDGIPGTAEVSAQWIPRYGEHDDWHPIRGTITQSGPDGKFALRGFAPRARDYTLHAYTSSSILPPHYTPFVVGQTNIDLSCEQGGAVIASALIDPTIEPADITCLLEPQQPTKRNLAAMNYMWRSPYGDQRAKQSVKGQAQWQWDGLVPGNYDLKVLVAGSGQPLDVISGLKVLAGEQCEDPRLHPIDLRDSLIKAAITVMNEAGSNLEKPAFVHAANTPMLAISTEDGVASIVGEPPMNLMVRAVGYQSEWLRNVTGPRLVSLKKSQEMIVTIAPVAIPTGWQAFVSGKVIGDTSNIKVMQSWGPSALETMMQHDCGVRIGDQAVLKIPAPLGSIISLRAYAMQDGNEDDTHTINLGSSSTIVANRASNQPMVLEIPASAIQTAIGQ